MRHSAGVRICDREELPHAGYTVGLDLAKTIFHVHGVTEGGEVAFNRPLRRAQVLAFFERLSPCLIGIEACASSHHWGRELSKLGLTVRLMPPMYVKPYVKRGKSDAVDAEAICEAVTRPTMRFVEIKSEDQQALLSLHRARDFVVRQRTQLINMLRSRPAEFGIAIARGVARAIDFAKGIIDGKQSGLPELAQDVPRGLSRQLVELHNRLRWYEITMRIQARLSRQAQLLQTIPGVGPVTASAVAATIGSGHQFKSGRKCASCRRNRAGKTLGRSATRRPPQSKLRRCWITSVAVASGRTAIFSTNAST